MFNITPSFGKTAQYIRVTVARRGTLATSEDKFFFIDFIEIISLVKALTHKNHAWVSHYWSTAYHYHGATGKGGFAYGVTSEMPLTPEEMDTLAATLLDFITHYEPD